MHLQWNLYCVCAIISVSYSFASSVQSVEESEGQRAYDMATEVYMSSFDRSKPPDEVIISSEPHSSKCF